MVRLALTLPSFRDTAEPAVAVARAADACGLDAVFAFDHLARFDRAGRQRPAIEGFTLLGAVAAETERVALGPLVARASLRPPATLAHCCETLQRISHGRLIVGVGTGDAESRVENETFGLPFSSRVDRLAELSAAVSELSGRGYPVWVGGTSRAAREMAVNAGGWNRWGGEPRQLAEGVEEIRRTGRPVVVSWAGLVVLAESESAARAKCDRLDPPPTAIVGGPERVAEQLRAFVAAGADWLIAGPVDSSAVENAAILAERVAPLLR